MSWPVLALAALIFAAVGVVAGTGILAVGVWLAPFGPDGTAGDGSWIGLTLRAVVVLCLLGQIVATILLARFEARMRRASRPQEPQEPENPVDSLIISQFEREVDEAFQRMRKGNPGA